jgi:hypothetical protein
MTHPANTSAKWIFDVEIEKLRAEFFVYVVKTNVMLIVDGKFLIDSLGRTC